MQERRDGRTFSVSPVAIRTLGKAQHEQHSSVAAEREAGKHGDSCAAARHTNGKPRE